MIGLSVIITTRNRALLLKNALDSIVKQTISPDAFEVITIDNGSLDNTKEVVESFSSSIKKLRYFYEEKPGLHIGRHKGMKEALSNILVYTDDDIEAFPTWLEGIRESFQDKDTVLVGGKILPKFEIPPPEWLAALWKKKTHQGNALAYLSLLDFGDESKKINPYYVWGCNFSIRKKILLEAGGFHPDAMPQDLIKYRGDGETGTSEFIFRKGYDAVYNPKASVYHFIPASRMTVDFFCRRAYNEGISDSYTIIRSKHTKGKKRGLFRLPDYLGRQKYVQLSQSLKKVAMLFPCFTKQARIQKKIFACSREGFCYHQDAVKSDSNLLIWVNRQNYMDKTENLS